MPWFHLNTITDSHDLTWMLNALLDNILNPSRNVISMRFSGFAKKKKKFQVSQAKPLRLIPATFVSPSVVWYVARDPTQSALPRHCTHTIPEESHFPFSIVKPMYPTSAVAVFCRVRAGRNVKGVWWARLTASQLLLQETKGVLRTNKRDLRSCSTVQACSESSVSKQRNKDRRPEKEAGSSSREQEQETFLCIDRGRDHVSLRWLFTGLLKPFSCWLKVLLNKVSYIIYVWFSPFPPKNLTRSKSSLDESTCTEEERGRGFYGLFKTPAGVSIILYTYIKSCLYLAGGKKHCEKICQNSSRVLVGTAERFLLYHPLLSLKQFPWVLENSR